MARLKIQKKVGTLVAFLILIGLVGGLKGSMSKLWAQEEPLYLSPTEPPIVYGLAGKDEFQAENWIRFSRSFAELGDYPKSRYFCNMLIRYYPNTFYALEAREILDRDSDPVKNRRRQKRKNNPGFYIK